MSLYKKALECGIASSNREENEQLFADIVRGHKAAQRLAEGNMGYVIKKVNGFLKEHPTFAYLRDDLNSEGFFVLSRIAQSVTEVCKNDFNPQGMISVSLRNAFLNMIRLERHVPLTDAIAETHTYSEGSATDLRLDIFDCCEDERERQIVHLRGGGLLDDEIAERLHIGRQWVSKTRQAIYERFQEKQER